jgi:hypothetical protein
MHFKKRIHKTVHIIPVVTYILTQQGTEMNGTSVQNEAQYAIMPNSILQQNFTSTMEPYLIFYW